MNHITSVPWRNTNNFQKKILSENKNNKLVCGYISMNVEAKEYLK